MNTSHDNIYSNTISLNTKPRCPHVPICPLPQVQFQDLNLRIKAGTVYQAAVPIQPKSTVASIPIPVRIPCSKYPTVVVVGSPISGSGD